MTVTTPSTTPRAGQQSVATPQAPFMQTERSRAPLQHYVRYNCMVPAVWHPSYPTLSHPLHCVHPRTSPSKAQLQCTTWTRNHSAVMQRPPLVFLLALSVAVTLPLIVTLLPTRSAPHPAARPSSVRGGLGVPERAHPLVPIPHQALLRRDAVRLALPARAADSTVSFATPLTLRSCGSRSAWSGAARHRCLRLRL